MWPAVTWNWPEAKETAASCVGVPSPQLTVAWYCVGSVLPSGSVKVATTAPAGAGAPSAKFSVWPPNPPEPPSPPPSPPPPSEPETTAVPGAALEAPPTSVKKTAVVYVPADA